MKKEGGEKARRGQVASLESGRLRESRVRRQPIHAVRPLPLACQGQGPRVLSIRAKGDGNRKENTANEARTTATATTTTTPLLS